MQKRRLFTAAVIMLLIVSFISENNMKADLIQMTDKEVGDNSLKFYPSSLEAIDQFVSNPAKVETRFATGDIFKIKVISKEADYYGVITTGQVEKVYSKDTKRIDHVIRIIEAYELMSMMDGSFRESGHGLNMPMRTGDEYYVNVIRKGDNLYEFVCPSFTCYKVSNSYNRIEVGVALPIPTEEKYQPIKCEFSPDVIDDYRHYFDSNCDPEIINRVEDVQNTILNRVMSLNQIN